VLELRTDDALRLEAEPVAVEAQGAVEVVDAEGEDGELGLHGAGLPDGAGLRR
jgi:hypothetical protein